MSEGLHADIWNFLLPIVCVCLLVAVLPGWFAGRDNESHRALGWAVFKTAIAAYAVGAVVMALLYGAINEGVYRQFVLDPIERANYFLSRSALMAMLWGPLLAYVWVVKSQEMNRRIGMKMLDVEDGKREKS